VKSLKRTISRSSPAPPASVCEPFRRSRQGSRSKMTPVNGREREHNGDAQFPRVSDAVGSGPVGYLSIRFAEPRRPCA